jgi:muramoyltetrapeptide carboxypeptidase
MCHFQLTVRVGTHPLSKRNSVPVSTLRPVHSISAGARVALVAPSGALRGETDLESSIENARAMGWEPVIGAHVLERDGYFAGSDEQRIEDLNFALNDESVSAIWCIRGGYGVMRILDRVDYDAIARRQLPIIGYSDITALLAAVGRKCGITTYHGPTARGALTPFSRDSLRRAVCTLDDPCGVALDGRTIRPGRAAGRLVGGNLALLASLCGTDFAPDLSHSILVLEDIGEPTYRIDRMIRQLLLSGSLSGCVGIIFGHCTNCPDDPSGRGLDHVLRETADLLQIPCFAGAPIGHIDDQWTVPFGALAEMDATLGSLNVVLRDES